MQASRLLQRLQTQASSVQPCHRPNVCFKDTLLHRSGRFHTLLPRTRSCRLNLPSSAFTPSCRWQACSSSSKTELGPGKIDTPEANQPTYELTFTCKPCLTRSSNHAVSKQAYHTGSVLVTCPNCKARHVISDHLKIFSEDGFNIEDFLRKNGNIVRKGSLDGDMEFWDDNSSSTRDLRRS